MSFDIKFTRLGFENTCRIAWQALRFNKRSQNLSIDTHLVFTIYRPVHLIMVLIIHSLENMFILIVIVTLLSTAYHFWREHPFYYVAIIFGIIFDSLRRKKKFFYEVDLKFLKIVWHFFPRCYKHLTSSFVMFCNLSTWRHLSKGADISKCADIGTHVTQLLSSSFNHLIFIAI